MQSNDRNTSQFGIHSCKIRSFFLFQFTKGYLLLYHDNIITALNTVSAIAGVAICVLLRVFIVDHCKGIM